MTPEGMTREEALQEVEDSLRRLTELVRARMRAAAKDVDPALSLFGLKVLQLLKGVGPLHPGAAAEMLMVDKSVISRQSRQLEELGLIEVQPDPQDGRARLLVLTQAAKERVTAVRTGIMLDPLVLGSWTIEELHEFAGYLTRLSRSGEPASAAPSALAEVR
ncbi:MarR family transcriptional regulator [Arthrobacter sp. Helios]|uniref:MarR family winged helix-turn-helix transcriptional regulator n=1 Tax=Arthrobacter sp. Helios TaxID=2828862 RepID=UPI00204F62ED|nr:MarR family transcriptional regulator [Arthrobacter sp. Helios]UPO78128.1 MarR family transcriptional regulator [Arthrobacter sp. Helios]